MVQPFRSPVFREEWSSGQLHGSGASGKVCGKEHAAPMSSLSWGTPSFSHFHGFTNPEALQKWSLQE